MKYFTNLAKYYDVQFHQAYQKEADFIEEVFKKHSQRKPRRILDLMCGTGSHSILLTKKGFEAMGIDNSEEMIQICNEKAEMNGVAIEYRFMDARQLDFKEAFDAAYCWFNSFQYLLTNEDVVNTLKGVRRALKDDGIFLIDIRNGTSVLLNMKDRLPLTITHEDKNVKFQNIIRSIKFDRTNQIATFTQDFIIEEKGLTRKEYEEHSYRLFHPLEFRYFLETNGFTVEKVYGEPDIHKEFDETSNKMIFVAIKK